jgi:hypothetical protein
MADEEHTDPRAELFQRIRPLCGSGPQAEQTARAIIALFTLVELREQDIDVTTLGAVRAELLRQRWLVAAVAHGPVRTVAGGHLGMLDDFGRPA